MGKDAQLTDEDSTGLEARIATLERRLATFELQTQFSGLDEVALAATILSPPALHCRVVKQPQLDRQESGTSTGLSYRPPRTPLSLGQDSDANTSAASEKTEENWRGRTDQSSGFNRANGVRVATIRPRSDSTSSKNRSESVTGPTPPREQSPSKTERRRKGDSSPKHQRLSHSQNVSPTSMNGHQKGSWETNGTSMNGGTGAHRHHVTLWGYLRTEVMGAERHWEVDTQANRTVKNFLTVPRHLERLLFFGLLICLDTFLYVPTFLPLRILGGICTFLRRLGRGRRRCSMTLAYDGMCGLMLIVCLGALQFVQLSRVYHYIRGQSMIKLYVLIGMVEIFDKLMCSFGQDALDSLYWSITCSKKRRTLMIFIIMCVQITIHSLLLFVHITTLTVAVNSSDQALLTLLISNNFAEIKSAVFKKFDKQNLFQLSCHDIVERFKLILFLAMIMLLNISHAGDDNLLAQFFNIAMLVFGGEVLADWIKHAFITKFNQILPAVYDEYAIILARDITSCGKDGNSVIDHTHTVARRLAFSTLPLSCVALRFIQIAAPRLKSYLPGVSVPHLWCIGALFYLIALAAKVLTGLHIMAYSYMLQGAHNDSRSGGKGAADGGQSTIYPSPAVKLSPKEQSLAKLSTIERFTLWKGRIV